jgi:hypothetical protein
MNDQQDDALFWAHEMSRAVELKDQDHQHYLLDLIRVLKLHPAGLRRWSVMRAIRKNRETDRFPIPQKMEDGVERVFRNHCADSENFKKRDGSPDAALFHWPQGKLGGVWAVYPDRADAWLKAAGLSIPA